MKLRRRATSERPLVIRHLKFVFARLAPTFRPFLESRWPTGLATVCATLFESTLHLKNIAARFAVWKPVITSAFFAFGRKSTRKRRGSEASLIMRNGSRTTKVGIFGNGLAMPILSSIGKTTERKFARY